MWRLLRFAAENGSGGAGGNEGDPPPAGGGGSGSGDGSGQGSEGNKTKTPRTQAETFKLVLTQEQRDRLLSTGELELAQDQYTGGVRQQMEGLRTRATSAETKLAEIAAAQEEAERKALVEQERFKDLYEQERQAREGEAKQRQEMALRHAFTVRAAKAGMVDPEAAFAIAREMPAFASVQVADNGAVSGMDELIKSLTEEKPYLVSQQKQPPVGGPSNPAPGTSDHKPAESQQEADDRIRARVRAAS